ncbi:hypothetical protein [Variovorax sp. LT1R16]|uniref:hypothetical protein n=1 Tax=Variovorax sp. LT1R16 TaxID=3443728 RepID=UPI003F4691D0
MNQQRLILLAEKLESLPATKFDLSAWRNFDFDLHDPDNASEDVETLSDRQLYENEQLLDDHCGTTACAVGWACAMPEFIKQGLTWNSTYGAPMFNAQIRWLAVREFFDLGQHTADHLFSDIEYDQDNATPADVAVRIRALVANGGTLTMPSDIQGLNRTP